MGFVYFVAFVDYSRQSPPGPVFLVFERRIAPLLLVIAMQDMRALTRPAGVMRRGRTR